MNNNNIPLPNSRKGGFSTLFPLAGLFLSCAQTMPAGAAEVVPFNTPSLNPLTQIFGVPSPQIPASQHPGQLSFSLQQEVASIYAVENRSQEQLLLDGEVWRSTLALGWDLSESWRLGLTVPYIRHRDGVLDGLINDWHDWFSMPTGGREDRPENAFLYHYQYAGQDILNMPKQEQGIGDLRLSATHAMDLNSRQLFLTLETKLPTGNADKLTGSGATDASLSAMIRDSSSLSGWNLTLFGGGGLAWLGDAERSLDERQNNWLWVTRVGGGWAPWPELHIKAQLDHHTALYDSELRALGSQALQLTAGLTWQIGSQTALEFAFSEDLVTTVTPDITFLAGLRHQFR